MFTVTQSADDLPSADRFAWWHDMTMAALIPTAMRTEHPDDFRASLTMVDLGLAQVSSMFYPSISRVRRTPRLIRRGDPEYLQLSLTVSGRMRLAQSRNEACFGDGGMVLYDSSHPFDGWALPSRGDGVHQILVQLPRRLLPARPDQLTALLSTALSSDGGFGEILARMLTQLTERPHEYGPEDAPRLGAVLIELLAATIGQHVDQRPHEPAERYPHALFLHVQSFVHHHLSDPELTPEAIARAHHLSPPPFAAPAVPTARHHRHRLRPPPAAGTGPSRAGQPPAGRRHGQRDRTPPRLPAARRVQPGLPRRLWRPTTRLPRRGPARRRPQPRAEALTFSREAPPPVTGPQG